MHSDNHAPPNCTPPGRCYHIGMPERDEIQIARWDAVRSRIGSGLRGMRGSSRSQARLAWELDELGFHISQSMVSRYEQGQGEVPLTLERMVGWALCCDALSSEHLREILELGGTRCHGRAAIWRSSTICFASTAPSRGPTRWWCAAGCSGTCSASSQRLRNRSSAYDRHHGARRYAPPTARALALAAARRRRAAAHLPPARHAPGDGRPLRRYRRVAGRRRRALDVSTRHGSARRRPARRRSPSPHVRPHRRPPARRRDPRTDRCEDRIPGEARHRLASGA